MSAVDVVSGETDGRNYCAAPLTVATLSSAVSCSSTHLNGEGKFFVNCLFAYVIIESISFQSHSNHQLPTCASDFKEVRSNCVSINFSFPKVKAKIKTSEKIFLPSRGEGRRRKK